MPPRSLSDEAERPAGRRALDAGTRERGIWFALAQARRARLARSVARGAGGLTVLALLTGAGAGVGTIAFRYMILGVTYLFTGHRAKEMLHTAEVAAEAAAMDAHRSYAAISPALLHKYESTISTTKTNTDAYVSATKGAATGLHTDRHRSGHRQQVTLVRSANGTLTRSCTISDTTSAHGGCENVSGTKSTW